MFSYNSFTHKTPFGAAKAGENIHILFPVFHCYFVTSVVMYLRRDDGFSTNVKLNYIGRNGDNNEFVCDFSLTDAGIYYYRFEVDISDGRRFYVGRNDDFGAIYGDWLPEWQLTVYNRIFSDIPIVGSGIIYHIFVDRFCAVGSRVFDKKGKLKPWNADVDIMNSDGEYFADDFYGGNLRGIISKLDYLADLNVEYLYLSPIFESHSNHRYDTGDYMRIDSLLGDEKDFDDLINAAKARGMGILLDGVFNHTGANSRYFNKFGVYDSVGAYQSQDSIYYKWYDFSQFPDKYNCWWGMTCVPTLNKSNEDCRKFIMGENGVLDHWTHKGIAGWRLDVVDEFPAEYTDKLCASIKKYKKDALIIGEVWEDASIKISYGELKPYFNGKQLDGVMNYVFKDAIISYALGCSCTDVRRKLMAIVENYPSYCLKRSMNLLGTHDTVRILNILSGYDVKNTDKGIRRGIVIDGDYLTNAVLKLKMCSVLQFTLPGLPTIYYGDEAGLQGYEDPLNRRTFPWDNINTRLLTHYIALGKIKKKYADILCGDTRFIASDKFLIFERKSKSGIIRVVASNNNYKCSYYIDGQYVDLLSGKEKANINEFIEPFGYRVLYRHCRSEE